MSLFFVGDINILKNKKLSPIECRVYFCLVSYMNRETGKCFPRYATISKDTGISKVSIHRAVHRLAKLRLITIKRKSSTNEYLLTQQHLLEKMRLKQVRLKFGTSEVKSSNVLIKPYKYNYNNRYVNKYNKTYDRGSYSRGGVANHSKLTLEYEGETYNNIGTEDHWIEFENKDGKRILKHKFKGIIKKKSKTAEGLRRLSEIKISKVN